MAKKDQYVIVPIKPFQGNDTAIETWCNERGEGATLWAVYLLKPGQPAEEMDNGYRSYDEAKAAWDKAN